MIGSTFAQQPDQRHARHVCFVQRGCVKSKNLPPGLGFLCSKIRILEKIPARLNALFIDGASWIMDPLTALGLAANIAQFIDFGSKLVSATEEIASAGQSISVAHLSTIAADLVDFNNILKHHLAFEATEVIQLINEQQVSTSKSQIPKL